MSQDKTFLTTGNPGNRKRAACGRPHPVHPAHHPAARAGLLPKPLLPERPLSSQAEALDLHGYKAGHGSLEAVKDVARGKGHEVVHEGRQGENE